MLGRLKRALGLFRPRTLARLARTDQRQQQQIDALTGEVHALRAAIGVAIRREQQLRDVVETEFASARARPPAPPAESPRD